MAKVLCYGACRTEPVLNALLHDKKKIYFLNPPYSRIAPALPLVLGFTPLLDAGVTHHVYLLIIQTREFIIPTVRYR